MSAISAVPRTISTEAASFVAERSMQADLERMIEQTRRTVSDLGRIEVQLAPPCDLGDEPRVIIEAWRTEAPTDGDRTESDLGA
jgi:hypothetical protein